jgi:hypothetical protein
MRISLHFLPALAQCSLAARWAIDTSCGKLFCPCDLQILTGYITASVKLNGGTVIDIRSRLQDAMREALDIATNAMEVIDQHSGDTNVQNIIRIVLGGDPAKVSSARGAYTSHVVGHYITVLRIFVTRLTYAYSSYRYFCFLDGLREESIPISTSRPPVAAAQKEH